MTYEFKRELKSLFTTSIISSVLTAIFMYMIYYRGWQSVAAGVCIGFTIPWAVTLYAEKIALKYLIKANLIVLLVINTLAHALIIFIVAVVFVVIFYMQGNFRDLLDNYRVLYSHFFIIGVSFGLLLSLLFNFFSILNTLIGRHILGKLFIGMYRKPIEVDRVFMFLDLKSSTAVAEKIGHLKFLSLVNDFFYDIDEPVRQTRGEIYKYVGDEAIITWTFKNAIQNANCIRCFSLIKKVIQKKADHYMDKYGIVPEFKAGLHGGISVTGELGYTKREIAYMGDVLNTTARIEEACKQYNEQLLVSGDLIRQINIPETMNTREVGEVTLRGKTQKMSLHAITFN